MSVIRDRGFAARYNDGCTGDCPTCGKCAELEPLASFIEQKSKHEPRAGYAIALDIGTTTVVSALVDLENGKVSDTHSFQNPQRAYGADIISRINASNTGHSDILRRIITECISAELNKFLAARNISDIVDMVVAANTTMIYLLLGLPCESLGRAPFIPTYQLDTEYTNLFTTPQIKCAARIVPWLSAFAGGDITAGTLYILHGKRTKSRFMLIDLGTNGEIALYDSGKLFVSSAAAGSAFEGELYKAERDTMQSLPKGASEVIRELASMVRMGIIDKTGLIKTNIYNGYEPVFTQKQIRTLQLAKSALRAGVAALLDLSGLDYRSLEALYIAGGTGYAVDAGDAVDIGLIDARLKDKIVNIGNSSLGGAVCMLRVPARTNAVIERLLSNVNELNLAAHPRFNDYFMEYMSF